MQFQQASQSKSGPSKRKNSNDAGSSSSQVTKSQKISKRNSSGSVVSVLNDSASWSSSPPPPARVSRQSSASSTGIANGAPSTLDPANVLTSNSTDLGSKALKFILSGSDLKTFMAEHWEKRPLCIQRENARHYDVLNVSRKSIDEMLRDPNNLIEYTKNVDVTKYENGERKTYNPGKSEARKLYLNHRESFCSRSMCVVSINFNDFVYNSFDSFPIDGRAYAASVWECYAQGCSIRK